MLAFFKSLKTAALLLVFFKTLLVENKLFSKPLCMQTFTAHDSRDFSLTKNLVAIIQHLLDLGKLSINDLVTLKENLYLNKITNPIESNHALTDPIAQIFFNEIETIIAQSDQLNTQELIHWIDKKISENIQYVDVVSTFQKKTSFLSDIADFHPLVINDNFHSIAMSTPVTQLLWVEVMGENPSFFREGPGSMEIKINKRWIRLRPDHPVEGVTYWSAIEFANRVSIINGINPLYDTRNIRYEKGTRAENGTLRNLDEEHRIEYFQNICEEEGGFRLPVFEEHLITLTKDSQGKTFFKQKKNIPLKYAWYFENSARQTQAVKTLKPISIQGHPFYDVEGNVGEWAFTDFSKDSCPFVEHKNGKFFSSHWSSVESAVGRDSCLFADPNSRCNKIGLRLFRTTVPNPKTKYK